MDMRELILLINKVKTIPKGDKGEQGDPGIDASVVDHKLVFTEKEE